jgi:hypothetical protein
MPQPFKLKNNGRVHFIRAGAKNLLSRPELVSHLVVINQMWAEIDNLLGVLLAVMTGAEAKSAITIYNALVSGPVKFEALKAVAMYKLNSDQLKVLEKILTNCRKISKERNDIVHGRWAISDDDKDVLFLIDTRWGLRSLTAWATINSAAMDYKDFVGDIKIMIYKEADFIGAESRIAELYDNLLKFLNSVEKSIAYST